MRLRRSATWCAALVVAATLLQACGGGPAASPTPVARLSALASELRAEEARIAALLEKPWAATLLPKAEFGDRRAALAAWLADAEAAASAPPETASAAAARLLPDGEGLPARGAAVRAAVAGAEDRAVALDAAWERRRSVAAPLAEIARHGPAPLAARVEAWNAALRDAENAFKRAITGIAKSGRADPSLERDLNIATGGFAAAEREGAGLFGEINRFAATAAEAARRQELFTSRLAWSEKVAAAAAKAGAPEAGAIDAAVAAARRFRDVELPRLSAEVFRFVGTCAPEAFDAHGRMANSVDAALASLQTAVRAPALRLGVGDPP